MDDATRTAAFADLFDRVDHCIQTASQEGQLTRGEALGAVFARTIAIMFSAQGRDTTVAMLRELEDRVGAWPEAMPEDAQSAQMAS